jgi:tyrosyl-tRNA synthetase
MLDHSVILENASSILAKLVKLIKFGEAGNGALSLNNDDWLSKINYLEFLRDFGPIFSVNRMLTMDSVSTRLERQQHLSFLEFNYMLLQAYDFMYLFENYGCQLQVGGADQWANMIFGVELIRKKTGKSAFGMSIPLLINSDGTKMGKTEGGTVWLDAALTSPFDFWQYWRNIDDRDVTKLLKLFTDIPIEEIEEYDSLVGTSAINDAKILLANAVTKFVHVDADVEAIKVAAMRTRDLAIKDDIIGLETYRIEKNTKIDQILVITKLAASKTASKRLLDGRAVKIDNTVITSYDETLTVSCILSVGKKKTVRLELI